MNVERDLVARRAIRNRERASIAERAAARDADHGRYQPGDGAEAMRCGPMAGRNAGQQPARVGMQRRGENIVHRSGLDDLARIHHRDPVGDVCHDAKVMGDQHQRHAEFTLQILEQRHDLRLDHDVERGRGLVGDDQRRLAHQRHGDHHALAQAAGELVRVLLQPQRRLRHAAALEQVFSTRPRRVRGAAAVAKVGFDQLVADRVDRIERRHRVLEDHRNPVAAQVREFATAECLEVAPTKRDCVCRQRGAVRLQPQDRQRGHGLAASGFADKAEGFARRHGEAHA